MKRCPHCKKLIVAKPAKCGSCGTAICGSKRLRFCSDTCRSRARRKREKEAIKDKSKER